MLSIPLVQLDPDLPVPAYAHEGDAGLDLRARSDVLLAAGGGRARVDTGFAIELPEGHAAFVVPRSGLAMRHGVTCLNAPGLVDSGFRGELGVLLVNHDPSVDYQVRRGDRIAQLVVVAAADVRFVLAAGLAGSERGAGGWGHSGR
ncbi:MAG: dUTP diphosphatase [Actinomycetota bacterium]|nr:dUTP diphosphatase [Actinomycetota bacterium]